MAKWTAVEVVRYVVVGQLSTETEVIRGAQGYHRSGRVTDRVELTFDWNQQEMTLAGTPTFKNFPSTVAVTEVEGCPPTKVSGTYDFLELAAVEQFSTMLRMTGTSRSLGGSIAGINEEQRCGAVWDDAVARSERVEIMMLILPTTYFGMPMPPGMSLSPDGKSIILADQSTGWSWTYTPTPLK
jgi:hypothetical protein